MSHLRVRIVLTVLTGVLTLGSEAAAQRVGQRGMPRRSPLIAPISIEFLTEDDSVSPLSNGQSISATDEFGRLVTISSTGANAGPAIFDSTPGGPNDPCQDLDLLVGLDNILILQNSLVPGQSTADLFDRPNDDQDGGELVFDFEAPVQPLSINLIDIDSGGNQGALVTLTDENGRARLYTVPPRWTGDRIADGTPGWQLLNLQLLSPQPGFQSIATATQHPAFDSLHVVKLVVRLGSSGGVDELLWIPGRAVGMAADGATRRVAVFDADLDQLLGVVPIPVADIDNHTVGDCAIDVRRRLGYVTNFERQVWVIDLALSPPQLAAGINPILIPNPGEDVDISPDGRFLAVSDGSHPTPMAIVDLDTRLVVGSASAGNDCNSIDFCDNGTLVGTSAVLTRLHRFVLAGNGTPSFTGNTLPIPNPNNVTCAPGDRAAVGVSTFPGGLHSLRVQGMTHVVSRGMNDSALSACFSPDGERLFIRQIAGIQAWPYDPLTGFVDVFSLYTVNAGALSTFYGMDRIVVHPDGARLYSVEPGGIRIHDPANGAQMGTVAGIYPMQDPGGIAVERGLR